MKKYVAILLLFAMFLQYVPVPASALANSDIIWDYFKDQGFSDAGVAGIMGNLQQESGFMPNNLENASNYKSGYTDEQFTSAVNNGSISRSAFISSAQFGVYAYNHGGTVYNTYGYGLAQWTFFSRKAALYDFARSKGSAIDDLNMQLDFIMHEMRNSYPSLINYLRTVTDISDACVHFHNVYEGSNDTAAMIQNRVNNAQRIYNKYHTGDSAIPGKPALLNMSSYYKPSDEIVFTWNPTSNTTHYNIYVHGLDDDGTYSDAIDPLFYAESGTSIQLQEGLYRVKLQSTNANAWNSEEDTWMYTNSDYVYFTVSETQAPGKPVIINFDSTYSEFENITIKWIETANTTHYNVYVQGLCDDGTYSDAIDPLFYAESGVSIQLPAGEYRVKVQSTNTNAWNSEEDTWMYTNSDFVYFTVSEADVPGKPVLLNMKSAYTTEETIVFKWNQTQNTTHYNVYVQGLCDDGTYSDAIDPLFYAESGVSIQLPAGEYRVKVQSTNTNAWNREEDTWMYTNGDFVYFSVEAHSHTEKIIPAVAPTCTQTGLTEGKKCSVCGEILVAQEEIAALGHDWGDTECTRCGATRENPFTDVPADSFFYEPVLWAVEDGITQGVSDITFAPAAGCNRAQVVTFLWRAEGSPEPAAYDHSFVDVPEGSFYEKAVLWAVENGITSGTDATHFDPAGFCNRAQAVTFLYRTFGAPNVEAAENPFGDVPDDTWYTAPVLWAVEQGITSGLNAECFGPNANCNRAQVVTFLYRAYID